MANDINGSLRNVLPGNIDEWNRVYATVAEANQAIPSTVVGGRNFREGKVVQIGTVTDHVEHRWIGGFEDHNLKEYTPSFLQKEDISAYKIVETDEEGKISRFVTGEGETWVKLHIDSLQDASIGESKLTEELINKINSGGGGGSGDIVIEEEGSYKVLFRDEDGKISLFQNSKGETWFKPHPDLKLNSNEEPFINDQVRADDDNLWRGKQTKFEVGTSDVAGYLFRPFPDVETPTVEIYNTSNTSIEIRKSLQLVTRGLKYMGTHIPTATNPLLRYRGTARNGSAPSGTILTGDYWRILAPDSDPNTAWVFNGVSLLRGDILFKTAGGWDKQSLTGANAAISGLYWDVISDGYFEDLTLKAGDRIYIIAKQAQGGQNGVFYSKHKYGEYYHKGEFTPSSFSAPANPSEFDLYQASVAGTFSGISFLKDDFLTYRYGAWRKFENSVPVTLTAGQSIVFSVKNTRELELRRVDKSNSRADITTDIRQTWINRKEDKNIIRVVGNSLAGAGGWVEKLDTMLVDNETGRRAYAYSYGGGMSWDCVDMIKYYISRGDTLRGSQFVFLIDTNDGYRFESMKRSIMEASKLIGSFQPKMLFMTDSSSVRLVWDYTLGRYKQTLTNPAQNGLEVVMRQWYKDMFPYNNFQTFDALLEQSKKSTVPHIQFPGMTEGAVATQYGISALSFYLSYYAKAYTPQQLNFVGYIDSPTDMPSNATGNNLDYYLRRSGTIGPDGIPVIKQNGIWADETIDIVHYNQTGAQALAEYFYQFMIENKF